MFLKDIKKLIEKEEDKLSRVDIAIIGTGPAGLSAALTAKNRNKSILLFGGEPVSSKVYKAHQVDNYLGLPQVKGEDMAKAFSNHLEKMNIEITKEQVTAAYSMGDFFMLQTSQNNSYEATSIIIASGVNFGKPYPGEVEFLGRGVSYCATCDAQLYRDKIVAVIAASKKEEEEARFLSQVAEKVYYIPLYLFEKKQEETEMKAASVEFDQIENIEIISDKPVSLEGTMKINTLVMQKGKLDVDGVFILRDSVPPAQLCPGVALDGNHIAVDRKLATNLPGCFACGDITGTPYQYMKAAGEGNVAALSAVSYVDGIQRSDEK